MPITQCHHCGCPDLMNRYPQMKSSVQNDSMMEWTVNDAISMLHGKVLYHFGDYGHGRGAWTMSYLFRLKKSMDNHHEIRGVRHQMEYTGSGFVVLR